MLFYKILWTNGNIVDIENNQVFNYILTRNQAILTLGNIEDLSETYDEKIDLEGGFYFRPLLIHMALFLKM